MDSNLRQVPACCWRQPRRLRTRHGCSTPASPTPPLPGILGPQHLVWLRQQRHAGCVRPPLEASGRGGQAAHVEGRGLGDGGEQSPGRGVEQEGSGRCADCMHRRVASWQRLHSSARSRRRRSDSPPSLPAQPTSTTLGCTLCTLNPVAPPSCFLMGHFFPLCGCCGCRGCCACCACCTATSAGGTQ